MKKPFVYGDLAEKENFIDRIEDRRQLKTFLCNGINVTLISPRRWGKSSLVKATMEEIVQEDKNTKVCFIDAFRINSEKEFYNSFVSAIINGVASSFDKCVDVLKGYLQSFNASFKLKGSFFEIDLNLSHKENSKCIEEILNLPEKIAQQRGLHIIVCIDEFQKMADFPEWAHMEGMLRSVWQHQQNVNYCLYGSKRHMMMNIFTNSNKPFYRFGQTLYLGKIASDYWVEYIVRTFKETNKSISEDMALRICTTMGNHSWYVQQLSFFIWAATEDEVTEEIFNRQLQAVIDTNTPVFENELDNMVPSQIAMLRAIANGENHLNATDVVNEYGLGAPQTITRNKKTLIMKDIIEKRNDNLVFVDPLFRLWFLSLRE